MAEDVTAEGIVSEFMRTLQAAKSEGKKREPKPGPWYLDRADPDRTRGLIRTLLPFITELDLWRISVPKCWVYHPRTVRGLLAAKARWEEIDKHEATTGAFGFYTTNLRDVKEQLLTFELERTHLIGKDEVSTIDDLEEFLVSTHFDRLYGEGEA